jgi:hypothetical protein
LLRPFQTLTTLSSILFGLLCSRNEGRVMNTTTRKCLMVMGVGAVIALYGAGVYRNELARQAPQVAVCSFGHCVPNNGTFSALR